jgi:adenosylhomocysteine nucleosidase
MSKKILVLAAMPEEMAFLSEQFTPHEKIKIKHLEFTQAKYAGYTLIFAVSGIGKVNAAICATLGIQHFHPELVLNIGASGGIHDHINVGDVAIAAMLQHHDANATQFGYAHGQIPRMPLAYASDKKLIDLLLSKQSQFSFKIFSGLVCSGDAFISDETFVLELKIKFPEILALDMESCALAQTCHQLDVEFCCIRGITDAAGKGADKSYKECLELAMNNANALFLALMEG